MERGEGDAVAAGLASFSDRARWWAWWAVLAGHGRGSSACEADAEHGEIDEGKLHGELVSGLIFGVLE